MTKDIQHYYTSEPAAKYKEYNISYSVKKHHYKFLSASGVFSKNRIDMGSDVLINAVIENENNLEMLLDLGCGIGVIGIVLSDVLDCKAVLCDINKRAVKLAKTNSRNYKAVVLESNGFEKIDGIFDIIITNPPIRAGKDLFYSWFEESKNHLIDEGRFYCVLLKKQGAPSAKKKLLSFFGNCEVIKRDNGYYVLCSTYYK